MQYRVVIQSSAKADIAEINALLAETISIAFADGWIWGLSQAAASLSKFPLRCPVSDESDAFDVTVRQLLYGKKPHVYRILFAVEADTVSILRVRHTRQQRLLQQSDDETD